MLESFKKTIKPSILCLSFLCVLLLVLVPVSVYGQMIEEGVIGGEIDYSTDAVEGSGIVLYVYRFVVAALGYLATLSGRLLDYVLTYFVFGYGHFYNTSFGYAVEVSWAVIRDLMNVAFIFGLVYVGFRFILFTDDGAVKRNLALIIIAALLVNFSLFFAKAIVDVSHGLIYEFNSQVGFIDLNAESTNSPTLSRLIISTFTVVSATGSGIQIEGTTGWAMVLLVTITMLILAFVFLAISIVLIVRTVVITFLLIFSPIMFIGWVFTGLAQYSRLWLTTFLRQCFLAPLVILFLYISLVITTEIFSTNQFQIDSDVAPTNNFNIYAGFALGVTFLIISLIAAQKLGSSAADSSVKMLQSGRQRLQRGSVRLARGTALAGGAAAAAGTGMALRNTRGLSAQKKLNDFKSGKIMLNQKQYETYQRRAQSSYDPRKLGDWMKQGGQRFAVKTGGVQQKAKDEQKRRKAFDDAKGELDVAEYAEMKADKLNKVASDYYKNNTKEKGVFVKKVTDYQDLVKQVSESESKIKAGESPIWTPDKPNEEELKQEKQKLELLKKQRDLKESGVKYARQLTQIEAEELEQNQNISMLRRAVDIGGARQYVNKSVTAEQRKRYGKDGENMEKDKKKRAQLEDLAKVMEEQGVTPSTSNDQSNKE